MGEGQTDWWRRPGKRVFVGTGRSELWRVHVPHLLSGLRQDRLLEGPPAEGQVVWLSEAGQPRGFSRRGIRIVRDGKLVDIHEPDAVEIVDPARTEERRYRRATVAAGMPDRLTRFVEPAGHYWEPDQMFAHGAEPGPYGEAYWACLKVRGRHVWRRAATWSEVCEARAAEAEDEAA